MELICYTVSVAVLVISVILSFFCKKLSGKFSRIKPIYILIAGAFVSVLSVMFYADHVTSGKGTTPFLPLLHTIQVMLTGYDFKIVDTVLASSAKYATLKYFYLSFVIFIAPILTFGFVLSFFETATSYIIYAFRRSAELYIISDLSEKTLALAESIKERFPKSLVLFMDVTSDTDKTGYELVYDARKTGALLFKKSINDVHVRFHSKKSKLAFFVMNDDESLNLETSLILIERFKKRPGTELYVTSVSSDGDLLLEHIEKGGMKVRRINEERTMAHNILCDYPITENAVQKDGKKLISGLVIGMGKYGTEIVKALLWCGQLPGYDLEINVIDKNPKTKSVFQANCPEIISLNGNTRVGEARYKLNFYEDIDVVTHEFNELVSSLTNTTAVYVCTGDDKLNIETAVNVHTLFERIGVYPAITTIVYSSIKHKTLGEMKLFNHMGNPYNIEILGNIKERYSYRSIVNEDLEKIALKCHLSWANSPEETEKSKIQFNNGEYYRNSSLATAIHQQYREREKLDKETAAIYEHMRWNAYMRTEGYVYSGSPDKSSRNDMAKMHHNLHMYGMLSREDAAKDNRIVESNNPDGTNAC